jgi:hypothetical protein
LRLRLLVPPQLNSGTLIWNDPASSDRFVWLRADHLSLYSCSVSVVEVNESAAEVGGFRRLIMLIFEDRLSPPSWSRFVGSCLSLGSRVFAAQRTRGFSTVGRLDR